MITSITSSSNSRINMAKSILARSTNDVGGVTFCTISVSLIAKTASLSSTDCTRTGTLTIMSMSSTTCAAYLAQKGYNGGLDFAEYHHGLRGNNGNEKDEDPDN